MGMFKKLLEAHFCSISTQSNVYGLARLPIADGMDKLIIATVRRKIYVFEYVLKQVNSSKAAQKCNSSNSLLPSSKEVHFTYIPSSAEIISIDTFNRSHNGNDFVVGITFMKKAEIDKSVEQNDIPAKQYFLNLYSDCDSGVSFNLDKLGQTCLSIQLDFIPYQLAHTELIHENCKEIIWLLSGNDHKVHMYREDKSNNCNGYIKDICEEYFPEFVDCPSIVLMMSIKYFDDYKRRLSVFGCENGYIRAALVKSESSEIIKSFTIKFGSPITCIKIFCEGNSFEWPSFLQTVNDDSLYGSDSSASDFLPQFHILACSAVECSTVFRNVLEEDFKNSQTLKNSNKFDCVLAGCIADIDMDGVNEILLGTYGQELLFYKLNPNTQIYECVWQKSLAHPILAIYYEDITDDGLKELLVLSVKGLHILQHDLDEVANLCVKRLKEVVISLSKKDTFKELQSEDLH